VLARNASKDVPARNLSAYVIDRNATEVLPVKTASKMCL
jgi:hypothetical protein